MTAPGGPPAPPVLAADAFERSVTAGLGRRRRRRRVDGARSAPPGCRSAAAAAALGLPDAGNETGASLGSVGAPRVDVRAAVGLSSAPTGTGTFVEVTGRRVGAGNEYTVRMRVAPDGAVYLALSRIVGGAETFPGGEVLVPGLTWTPGTVLQVRVRVTGTGTTTVTGSVWATRRRPSPRRRSCRAPTPPPALQARGRGRDRRLPARLGDGRDRRAVRRPGGHRRAVTPDAGPAPREPARRAVPRSARASRLTHCVIDLITPEGGNRRSPPHRAIGKAVTDCHRHCRYSTTASRGRPPASGDQAHGGNRMSTSSTAPWRAPVRVVAGTVSLLLAAGSLALLPGTAQADSAPLAPSASHAGHGDRRRAAHRADQRRRLVPGRRRQHRLRRWLVHQRPPRRCAARHERDAAQQPARLRHPHRRADHLLRARPSTARCWPSRPRPTARASTSAGDFTTVDGQTRRRVAAFDTATGALVAGFAPGRAEPGRGARRHERHRLHGRQHHRGRQRQPQPARRGPRLRRRPAAVGPGPGRRLDRRQQSNGDTQHQRRRPRADRRQHRPGHRRRPVRHA